MEYSYTDLGPDSITRKFVDKTACRSTAIRSLLISFVGSILAVILIYLIFVLIQRILVPIEDIPFYLNIVLAAGMVVFFSWPVICLMGFVIMIFGAGLVAIRMLLRNDFPSQSDDPDVVSNYIDRSAGEHQGAVHLEIDVMNSELTDTLGINDVKADVIGSIEIASLPGMWYKVKSKRGTYSILCVKVSHTLPSTVINSLIDENDILPNKFINAQMIDINSQVSDYFKIYTVPGAEQEIYQLLPPNVLWQLLIELDSCDVVFRDRTMYFVWPEGLLSDTVLKGRSRQIEKFVTTFSQGVRHDSSSNVYLSYDTKKPAFDTIRTLIVGAIVITIAISGATFAAILANHGSLSELIIFPIVIMLPGFIFGLCLMLSFILSLIISRTIFYIWSVISSLPKIKKYMLYYDGRK